MIGGPRLPMSATAEGELSAAAQMNRASSWSQTGDHESYLTAEAGAEESIDAWAHSLTGAPAQDDNAFSSMQQTPRGGSAKLLMHGGSSLGSPMRGRGRSATGESSPLGLFTSTSVHSSDNNADVPEHDLDASLEDDEDGSGTDSGSEKRFPDLFEPNRSRSPAHRRSQSTRSHSRYSVKRPSDNSQDGSGFLTTTRDQNSSRRRRDSTPDLTYSRATHSDGLESPLHASLVARTETAGTEFSEQPDYPPQDSDSDSDEPIEIARRKRPSTSGSP